MTGWTFASVSLEFTDEIIGLSAEVVTTAWDLDLWEQINNAAGSYIDDFETANIEVDKLSVTIDVIGDYLARLPEEVEGDRTIWRRVIELLREGQRRGIRVRFVI